MRKHKCILLVDDKNQKDVSESIVMQLRNEYDVEFILIRTKASEFKQSDSDELDLEKLKIGIKTSLQHKSIDVALTDFDLDCDIINGLDIIRMVHEIRPNVNFLVYSGNWSSVIRTLLGDDYKNVSIDDLLNKGINAFISEKIVNCIDRTDYRSALINYLKKHNDNTIEHRLSTLLRAHGDFKFRSCFPDFKGMTFNEIADMIDDPSDTRTNDWINTILAQTLAYLVMVNK